MKFVQRADHDAYSALNRYSRVDPNSAPTDLSILTSPLSRLFDPSAVDAPSLPDPRPRLHSYEIPSDVGASPDLSENSHDKASSGPEVIPADYLESSERQNKSSRRAQKIDLSDQVSEQPRILLTRLAYQEQLPEPSDAFAVTPLTIPPSAWKAIPPECRTRIFDFPAIRDQYETSFGEPPPSSELDLARRVNFSEVLRLALLNSREYQSQKEQLYRVALRLSLEQYDYQLKFAPFGNSTGLGYTNISNNIESQRTLGIPTQVQAEALLATGTNFVTRFANDVLLTFNGPDGFAADISSEMLFGLSHSVFQNDIRFEGLTQAERNVIYEARNFARFRRTFYLQVATQYYNLLRSYRQVEIDAQKYLSLVRVYGQREVEFAAGEVARIQIDQVEQNTLDTRSTLINNCNSLDIAVDQLKLRLGVPTETPLQINLEELFALTRSDERLVKLELVKRVEARLSAELNRETVDDVALLSLTSEFVSRMQDVAKLAEQTSETLPPQPGHDALQDRYAKLLAYLRTAERRAMSSRVLRRLQTEQTDPKSPAIRVPELSAVFARSTLSMLKEETALAKTLSAPTEAVAEIESQTEQLAEQLKQYETSLDEILSSVQLQQLADLRHQADQLVESTVSVAKLAYEQNAQLMDRKALGVEDTVEATVKRLLSESQTLLANREGTLAPIDIDFDTASLTAMVQRLDLANARGTMFDEWRGSKLRADDLKSILNLQARQRLITQNQVSRPMELDLDESRTELAVTIDTPLNRRAQRNTFREQLLNYQFARRDVMALEDTIKFDIRNDLRSIRLSGEQHSLGIASAALAYERVISTELQLRLGVPGVAARDYLESQNAYANSLSTVAARHLGYITARITLFTNLEQLQLDSEGQWAGLNDPNWLPEIVGEESFWQGYGELPDWMHYTKELRERSQQYWSPPINPVPVDSPQ